MAQVIYSNQFSEPRNLIVSLISNKSNVSDPITSTSGFRKWIYSRYPDVKSTDFKGYPFIVIKGTELENEKIETSADGRSKFVNYDIEIEIYTSDRGYGSQDGKGLQYMDSISDSVIKTLMNITNRKSLKNNNLSMASVDPTPVSEQVLKDEITYKRIIPISFRSWMKVSA